MRSQTLYSILIALLAAVTLYACGGGGGGSTPSTTTVFGYVTDDLGGYESVKLTLNTVQLRHTSGRTCEIIAGPLELDAAEFGREQLVEQVNTTECDTGQYNRLYVELDGDVILKQNASSPDQQKCRFVSYYEDNTLRPNRLACAADPNDSTKTICSLEITGAVNLIARTRENVALDVDLKEFTVDTTPTPCEVTLKVSPVRADNKLAAGYRTSISGTVSDVNANSFTLTVRGGSTYTVDYTGVTDQGGLDELLRRAATDGLRTTVRCQTINTSTTPHPTCVAQTVATQPLKAITVRAKGTISALNTTAQTFTLGYGAARTMPLNYAKAVELGKVEGTLADNAVAGVKLYGSIIVPTIPPATTTHFLAREVEVQ